MRRKVNKGRVSERTKIGVSNGERFLMVEEWRAQDAVDSLGARLISCINTEHVEAVWIEYRQPDSADGTVVSVFVCRFSGFAV